MMMKSFVAEKPAKLIKLALSEIDDLTRSALLTALKKRDVKINGKRVGDDVTLSVGDRVEVYYIPKENVKFSLVYSDDMIVVVNKKKGVSSESVFESVKKQFKSASFIHRLDTNTDGLMIFGLTAESELELLKGFKNHTFIKKYRATVVGCPKKKEDLLTAFLRKDKDAAEVKIFDKQVKDSKPIKTGYKVIETNGETSVLEVTLFTGKTHQIRAHLAYIGYPIVGDGKYGNFAFNQKCGAKTQMLTAYELTLNFDKDSPLYHLSGKKFFIDN